MPDDKDAIARRLKAAFNDTRSPSEREARAKRDATLEAHKSDTVQRIASSMLGIRPEHGDTIYTQHPVMAGVVRRALLEAYEAGTAEVARLVLESAFDRHRDE